MSVSRDVQRCCEFPIWRIWDGPKNSLIIGSKGMLKVLPKLRSRHHESERAHQHANIHSLESKNRRPIQHWWMLHCCIACPLAIRRRESAMLCQASIHFSICMFAKKDWYIINKVQYAALVLDWEKLTQNSFWVGNICQLWLFYAIIAVETFAATRMLNSQNSLGADTGERVTPPTALL